VSHHIPPNPELMSPYRVPGVYQSEAPAVPACPMCSGEADPMKLIAKSVCGYHTIQCTLATRRFTDALPDLMGWERLGRHLLWERIEKAYAWLRSKAVVHNGEPQFSVFPLDYVDVQRVVFDLHLRESGVHYRASCAVGSHGTFSPHALEEVAALLEEGVEDVRADEQRRRIVRIEAGGSP